MRMLDRLYCTCTLCTAFTIVAIAQDNAKGSTVASYMSYKPFPGFCILANFASYCILRSFLQLLCRNSCRLVSCNQRTVWILLVTLAFAIWLPVSLPFCLYVFPLFDPTLPPLTLAAAPALAFSRPLAHLGVSRLARRSCVSRSKGPDGSLRSVSQGAADVGLTWSISWPSNDGADGLGFGEPIPRDRRLLIPATGRSRPCLASSRWPAVAGRPCEGLACPDAHRLADFAKFHDLCSHGRLGGRPWRVPSRPPTPYREASSSELDLLSAPLKSRTPSSPRSLLSHSHSSSVHCGWW